MSRPLIADFWIIFCNLSPIFRHLRRSRDCCHNARRRSPLPFRFQVSKSEAPKLRGLVTSQLVYEQPIPTRRTFLIVGRSVSVNGRSGHGQVNWSHSVTISRIHTPLTFWLYVLCAIAVAIFGTRFEIRNREGLWEDGEIVRRKIFLSIGLFVFLLVVYASFLFKFYTGPAVPEPFTNPGLFLKPCLIAAFPFAVLAYADKNWTSHDAAPVCAGGWVAACAVLVNKHPMCAVGLGFSFLPFVATALVAYGIGTLGSSLKQRTQSLHSA